MFVCVWAVKAVDLGNTHVLNDACSFVSIQTADLGPLYHKMLPGVAHFTVQSEAQNNNTSG